MVKEERQDPPEVFAIPVEREYTVDVLGFLVNVHRISIRLCSIYGKKERSRLILTSIPRYFLKNFLQCPFRLKSPTTSLRNDNLSVDDVL